jgi:serine/threonine protein kinase
MEFVEGESLRSLLEREGKLEIGRATEFARQLAGGLAEAHRQSIVHRDLKPENIMIGPDGRLKVMDFGISRSYAEDATVTGSVVGTPAYMAPNRPRATRWTIARTSTRSAWCSTKCSPEKPRSKGTQRLPWR